MLAEHEQGDPEQINTHSWNMIKEHLYSSFVHMVDIPYIVQDNTHTVPVSVIQRLPSKHNPLNKPTEKQNLLLLLLQL